MSTPMQRAEWRRDTERWPYVEPSTSPSAVLVLLDELEAAEAENERLKATVLHFPACACHQCNSAQQTQVGWYSPSAKTFARTWEMNPNAPLYKGDHVPVYVLLDTEAKP